MPRLQLLSFEGCPHAAAARANLTAALHETGLRERWEEIDLRDARTPAALRGFPSPTVLVDGRDAVSGAREARGESACRLEGAPGVEAIVRALRAAG